MIPYGREYTGSKMVFLIFSVPATDMQKFGNSQHMHMKCVFEQYSVGRELEKKTFWKNIFIGIQTHLRILDLGIKPKNTW